MITVHIVHVEKQKWEIIITLALALRIVQTVTVGSITRETIMPICSSINTRVTKFTPNF